MTLFLKRTLRLTVIAMILCGSQYFAAAQKPAEGLPAEITADEFPRTRGLGDEITGGTDVFKFKAKPTYRLKRTTPRVKHVAAKLSSGPKPNLRLPVDNKSEEVWKRLGVTIWRLDSDGKPAAGVKEAARLLVQESGKNREYTPERAAASTVFKRGDKVRLSFESPIQGYLYVLDREIYADGKVGDPYQIFPTMMARGGNNLIQGGSVIDVPSQADHAPYFDLTSSDPNWRGELLTIIVSPEPLTDLGLPDKASRITAALIEALEDKYLKDAAEYEQNGTAGQTYTKTEKEAGADGKRQLTQNDPFPQTVYRVKTRPKEPMVINLSLSVR